MQSRQGEETSNADKSRQKVVNLQILGAQDEETIKADTSRQNTMNLKDLSEFAR